MIKFEPYFHIGSYELARELHDRGGYSDKSVDEVHRMVCDLFNVEYSSDFTQLVHTGYDEILEMRGRSEEEKYIACQIVSLLQTDNMNVLAYTDTFCIEF